MHSSYEVSQLTAILMINQRNSQTMIICYLSGDYIYILYILFRPLKFRIRNKYCLTFYSYFVSLSFVKNCLCIFEGKKFNKSKVSLCKRWSFLLILIFNQSDVLNLCKLWENIHKLKINNKVIILIYLQLSRRTLSWYFLSPLDWYKAIQFKEAKWQVVT